MSVKQCVKFSKMAKCLERMLHNTLKASKGSATHQQNGLGRATGTSQA